MAFLNEHDSDLRPAMALALQRKALASAMPGQAVDPNANPWEAFRAAGLDFEARSAPLAADITAYDPSAHGEGGVVLSDCPDHKAVIGADGLGVVGVVGSTYGIVQHADAFRGLAHLCERGDAALCRIEAEPNGRSFRASALLGFSTVREKDDIAHYLQSSNSHGGDATASGGLWSLNQLCANGMTKRVLKGGGRVVHRRHASHRALDLAPAMVTAVELAKEEAREYREMYSHRLTLDDFVRQAEGILTEARGEADTDRKQKRRADDVEELAWLFNRGAGNEGANAFDSFNAFTDWLTKRREDYASASAFASASAGYGSAADRTREIARRRILREVRRR